MEYWVIFASLAPVRVPTEARKALKAASSVPESARVAAAPAKTERDLAAASKGASSKTIACLSKNTAIREAKPPPREWPEKDMVAVGWACFSLK